MPWPWEPASIRYNNPGAMYPGSSATAFGSTGFGTIGGGHKIAQFDDPESGAAAQFHLLRNRYSNLPLGQAITTWSGGNSSPAYIQSVSNSLGIAPDTPVSTILGNPAQAVSLAKAMAKYEAGKDYPLTDEQWMNAYNRVPGDSSGAGAPQGRQMPNSLMDLMSGRQQPMDTLGQPTDWGGALAARSNSLIGLGLGLMQPRYPGQNTYAQALQGLMAGSQADESSAQNAWKRSLAEREFARGGETEFQKMQRDLTRYAGTPYADEVKRFYAAKMGETPQLVTLNLDPTDPENKTSALFNPRAPMGQQFTDLQGRPLGIGGQQAATAGGGNAFAAGGGGAPGYGAAGMGPGGFGTGFGQTTTQPPSPPTPQYRMGPKAQEFAHELRKEINQLPEVKRVGEAMPIYRSMIESHTKGTAAADLDFVYGVAKIFDPDSVVREGEMKLVGQARSLPEDIQGWMSKVVYGGARLPVEVRQRILEVAAIRMNQLNESYKQRISPYNDILAQSRLNPRVVLPQMLDLPDLPAAKDEAPATSGKKPPPVQRWGQDAQGNPIPIPSP